MDFLAPQNCTCNILRRANRHITNYFDSQIKNHGIKITQFTILSYIASLEGETISDISKVMKMDRTTFSRAISILEESRFISILDGDEDKRERRVKLTVLGKEKLKDVQNSWKNAQKKLVQRIGEDQWSNLIKVLKNIEELD